MKDDLNPDVIGMRPLENMFRDFRLVMDKFGLVQDRPGEWHGNGVLRSAEAAICILQNMALKPYGTEDERERDDLFALMANGVKSCLVPGSIVRYRKHPIAFQADQNSQDNLIGLGTLSSFLGGRWARAVCEAGSQGYTLKGVRLPWYFPNTPEGEQGFDWKAFMLRYPALIRHMRRAGGLRDRLWLYPLHFVLRLWWSFSVASAGFLRGTNEGAEDAWCLAWVMLS